jgi:Recombination endonuclease VII
MPYKDPEVRRASWKRRYYEKRENEQWIEDEKIRLREYRKLHPEQARNAQLKYNFGITIEDFEKLLEKQDGACAVCKTSFTKTPHVDHDHSSNKVRGLLCLSCNTALGNMRDSVEILAAAIEYLNKYKEN